LLRSRKRYPLLNPSVGHRTFPARQLNLLERICDWQKPMCVHDRFGETNGVDAQDLQARTLLASSV
jgi:hypothetical protein